MKPVLTAFQHLAQITAAKPETPQEEKFQRRYGKLIQDRVGTRKTKTNQKFIIFETLFFENDKKIFKFSH